MKIHTEGKATSEQQSRLSDLLGLGRILLALFLLLSFITFDPGDPTLNQSVSGDYAVRNGAGLLGAYIGGSLVEFFGVAAYCFPVILVLQGLGRLLGGYRFAWWRWLGVVLFFAWIVAFAGTPWSDRHLVAGKVAGGGFLGDMLYAWGRFILRPAGALIIWLLLLPVSLQLLAGRVWTFPNKGTAERVRSMARAIREWVESFQFFQRKPEKDRDTFEFSPLPGSGAVAEEMDSDIEFVQPVDSNKPEEKPLRKKRAVKPKRKKPRTPSGRNELPSVELLDQATKDANPVSKNVLQAKAKALVECLANFSIQGEVTAITPGPVVTMFEYRPAPGVKISRIANLSNDLALALKALAVRIEAPIPGKNAVGIEIPNEQRQTVNFREILESNNFLTSKSLLSLAVGKDIAGSPRVVDLARMPHLLVAGATGAGKSVCLNSLLISMLYKARPDEVKFLLIDPKRIELAVYADLPHLVHPVVTDMSQAKNALDWAVHEMDQRYEAMAKMGVRNIESYNTKFRKLAADPRGMPEGLEDLEFMPFLVLIIDELADLMLTAAKEVEMSIVRLAQLARAAGIHMILATQRPSVDVVTGLIKANFPSRISFQVTSRHDSRTILDTVGAEYLLGKGDMLYKPSGGKLVRLHGAFVSDQDVVSVVDFWRSQQRPAYSLDFSEWGADEAGSGLDGPGEGVADDPMYKQAVEFVRSQGKASISMVQRRFRIGYNKAARFIEQMEVDGVVGPADGSRPRAVLKD